MKCGWALVLYMSKTNATLGYGKDLCTESAFVNVVDRVMVCPSFLGSDPQNL